MEIKKISPKKRKWRKLTNCKPNNEGKNPKPAVNATPLNPCWNACCCWCANDGPGVGLCAFGRFGISVFNL